MNVQLPMPVVAAALHILLGSEVWDNIVDFLFELTGPFEELLSDCVLSRAAPTIKCRVPKNSAPSSLYSCR